MAGEGGDGEAGDAAMISLQECRELDAADPLAPLRERFERSSTGAIYLDGNSVGPMPREVPERLQRLLREGWVDARRRGWSRFDWLERAHSLGADLAPLIGAGANDVVFADSTTVNVFKLLAHAWRARCESRPLIVAERYSFPSDLYAAQGLAHLLQGRAELRFIDAPEQLAQALDARVGVVLLSHVDYRSSRRWDMAATNAMAHAVGARVLWDLSHSAGAVHIALQDHGADYAVGCGYKYLCGGPGAPAWLYVHPTLQGEGWPVLAGWMGHAHTFDFAPEYEPGAGMHRHLSGTPPVIAHEALAAAASIWRHTDAKALGRKHHCLLRTVLALLKPWGQAQGLRLLSPAEPEACGGHVALGHEGAGAIVEALVEAGVVCSFRQPDAIRFGLSPLALSHEDLWWAMQRLQQVLLSGVWREPRFARVAV